MEPALIPLYCCWYNLKTAKALKFQRQCSPAPNEVIE
jgi:hypothetical protein